MVVAQENLQSRFDVGLELLNLARDRCAVALREAHVNLTTLEIKLQQKPTMSVRAVLIFRVLDEPAAPPCSHYDNFSCPLVMRS